MQRILIHVGPPKTGTSVIQKFLHENRSALMDKGIYYPEHFVDSNGVSTGNKEAIYSENVFDPEKLKRLIAKAKGKGAHTLLLSSEAFYVDLEDIYDACPRARFILYLRQPLQNMESYYNQAVKRNRKTEKFSVQNIDYARFKRLERYIEYCGNSSLLVRYYQPRCFKGGSLISDFLQNLDIPLSGDGFDPVINPSYSLSALEFKRRVNHVAISKYADYQLDKTLQKFPGGRKKFSLTPPDIYERYLREIIEKLNTLFKKHSLPGFESFLSELADERPRPYASQDLTQGEA
ncbi:MAG: hypothetical protein ACPF9D_10285, partial [Owenweeksia sp.]